MEKAIMSHDDFDVFIIYESDEYILEKRLTFEHSIPRVVGFWDLLEKITILLIATIGWNLDEVLF